MNKDTGIKREINKEHNSTQKMEKGQVRRRKVDIKRIAGSEWCRIERHTRFTVR